MVVFPNCKINLGLHLLSKRADGYHNLETVFFPIPVYDALEVISSENLTFNTSGLAIDGKTSDNICLAAYHLLKADFPQLPYVDIWLHKAIPMGAGLGGGSSNGASMLQLLNKKYNLLIDQPTLLAYALKLGSDCPFFIVNQPAFATGRGENLEPMPIKLGDYQIVIVNPRIHISTKEAFSKITPAIPAKSIKTIIHQPIDTWKNELINDFEAALFPFYPAIAAIKQTLYDSGATYASMTGSGSTVYGIFPKNITPSFTFPPAYLTILRNLS